VNSSYRSSSVRNSRLRSKNSTHKGFHLPSLVDVQFSHRLLSFDAEINKQNDKIIFEENCVNKRAQIKGKSTKNKKIPIIHEHRSSNFVLVTRKQTNPSEQHISFQFDPIFHPRVQVDHKPPTDSNILTDLLLKQEQASNRHNRNFYSSVDSIS